MSTTAASSSPSFRIDVIFNSLRELQQEKERLQQFYNEEKARRKSLENKLEACQVKYQQCSEKNTKMFETVNAARQKVLQTQNQANRLKELNDEKGAKIAELHKQIDEEYKNEDRELQIFEAQLAELTENFRNAKNYYTKDNMMKETEEWFKQAEDAKAEACREDNSLKGLAAKFDQLELETNSLRDNMKTKLEFDLTVEELQSALTVFKEMEKETKRDLDKAEKQLQQEVQRLEQAKEEQNRRKTTGGAPQTGPRLGTVTAPVHVSQQLSSGGSVINLSDSAIQQSTSSPYAHVSQFHSSESSSREVYERPVIDQGSNRQSVQVAYSHSVTPVSVGSPLIQTPVQQQGRRSSLQGRSFFISLPFTSNS